HNDKAQLPKARNASKNLFQVYKQGVLINLFNPKIALFFLAFLPQFIDGGNTQRAFAFLVLGLVFNLTDACINSLAAWIVSAMSQYAQKASHIGYGLKKAVGGIFIGLGIKLAAQE